jgi:hypothetical protein
VVVLPITPQQCQLGCRAAASCFQHQSHTVRRMFVSASWSTYPYCQAAYLLPIPAVVECPLPSISSPIAQTASGTRGKVVSPRARTRVERLRLPYLATRHGVVLLQALPSAACARWASPQFLTETEGLSLGVARDAFMGQELSAFFQMAGLLQTWRWSYAPLSFRLVIPNVDMRAFYKARIRFVKWKAFTRLKCCDSLQEFNVSFLKLVVPCDSRPINRLPQTSLSEGLVVVQTPSPWNR